MASNDNGSNLDFGFGFNNIHFSDRVLRIEIEREDEVEGESTRPKKRTKKGNKLCNIEMKTVHINSIILAAKSPFFFKLFSNGMKESEERHATLQIDSSEEMALMDLLNFMYCNTLSSETSSSLLDVLMVADKFQVSSCMRYCSQLLCKLPMTCESALEYLDLPSTVSMENDVQSLVDAAKKYLLDRYKDFTEFEAEMLKLSLAGVEVVLSSDALKVTSEDAVYDFVLKWTRKHYQNIEERREILTTRLGSLIRFKFMSCKKLEEIPSCSDFDPAYSSRVLLDALLFKGQSPHSHTFSGFEERSYKYRPVKVLQSMFPFPHCVVYLDLKKQVCDNLLPSQKVYSEDFHLGGKCFYLAAKHSTKDNNGMPCDNFGLYLVSNQKEPCLWPVSYEFSARSKPTEDFSRCRIKLTHTFTDLGEYWGYHNLFKVSWSEFIAENSIYFINEVLYLKVEITMKAWLGVTIR